MKHFLITFALALFAQITNAQDLNIYYDVQHDTILSYQMNGKTITKPKAIMNRQIILHLENINDYLFDADVSVDARDIDIPKGSGIEKMLTPSTNFPDFLSQYGSMNLPPQQYNKIPIVSPAGSVRAPGVEPEKSKDEKFPDSILIMEINTQQEIDNRLTDEFNQLIGELTEIEAQLKEIIDQVDQTIVAGKTRIFAINEVNRLKLRPDLPPKVIKKLALEYLEAGLEVTSPSDLNINSLTSKFNSKEKITTQIELLKTIRNNYLQKAKEIKFFPNNFNTVGVSEHLKRTFLQEISKVMETSQLVEIKTKNYLQNVDKISPEIIKAEQIDHLLELRNEYEAISNRPFSKIIRLPVTKDLADITISLIPKDTSIVGMPKKIKTMSPIRVNTAGGIKVNISGGISFGKFKTGPLSYYVRDSIIHADKADSHTPFLTSFMHFYWQSAGNTSLGLSLGAGLPLGTEQRIKTPVFFIGPSILLGKSNRMVLTFGAMSAKLSTLGEGYAVNDTFIINESAQLPLVDRYQTGIFLGISYNIK